MNSKHEATNICRRLLRALGVVPDACENASYGSDLSAMIEGYRPAMWIHGHVHQSCDYVVGTDYGTRIVCNPRGYATPRSDGQLPGNHEFLTDLVIEI